MPFIQDGSESEDGHRPYHQELTLHSLEGDGSKTPEPYERPPNPGPYSQRPGRRRSTNELSALSQRQSMVSTISRASTRFSMTPSDLQHPITLLEGDQERAEALLGLRSHDEVPVTVTPTPRARSPAANAPRRGCHRGTGPEFDEPVNGRMAWLQACLAVLIVFNCWGFSNAFGLFQAYYERSYIPDTPPGAISWIGSTQLALVFGLGVPVGRLVDKGYFRIAFHGGSVLMIVGLFCSSFCHTFATLWFVQGFLTGIGMGCVFTAGLVTLMSWFDERKMGIALGLPAAGSCVGGIVYILISRKCLATMGFGPTMRILSGVSLATMIIPNILFRQRRVPLRCTRLEVHHEQRFALRLFTDPAYLLAATGMFLSFEGLYFGFVYLISYASQTLKLSDTAATNMLIYMLIANLPGRILPALISDKCTGPINTMIPSTILSSAVIWLWAASTSTQSSLTVIACFYGFISGGIQALYAPSTYSFCLEPAADGLEGRQVVIDRIGLKAGGVFSTIGVAVLIGTPIGGALISYRADRGLEDPYLGAQIFAGVSLLLGGCFLLASRVKKVGFEPRRA